MPKYFCDSSLNPEISPLYRETDDNSEYYDRKEKCWRTCDPFWWAELGDNVCEISESEVLNIILQS